MNTKDQIKGNENHLQLIKLAVICLAGVSLFTTAKGMNEYIFHNDALSYAASTAIQGILLAMSMGLPRYLEGIWKNHWNFFLRIVLCIIILLLTVVAMFCSSWFSYIYIADVVHLDSWGTDSELLVQQTYRTELYDARDYAHVYRIYLEEDMGEKILMLQTQADDISEDKQLDNLNIDWNQERTEYGDTNTTAGSYMVSVISAMQNAMQTNSTQNSRDLAVQAVADAQSNISKRMDDIQRQLNEYAADIDKYDAQIAKQNDTIRKATENTDISGLIASVNNNITQMERATNKRNTLQEEYELLDKASSRLLAYQAQLGLNNTASSIAIRKDILDMQTEFFQDDLDEEQLIATATSIFENIRNAASYNDEDNLSYTNLLVQMNQLILNLRDYSDIKEVESSLDDFIKELRNEVIDESSINDEKTSDFEIVDNEDEETNDDSTDEEQDSEEWKKEWKDRLQKLKLQISSMPVYSAVQKETTSNILTDSQLDTLLAYDRNESSNRLDDLIRLYIAEHNALYQGIIYLLSPYKMLAVFSLVLAFSFDVSGFILGFASQGENQQKGMGDASDINKHEKITEVENTVLWSIIPSLNKYKILTGDYEKKDQTYIYQVFEDGILQKWNVEDAVPYVQGIYLQDKATETKGMLLSASEQSILFANQPGGPVDGVYLDCCLEFEEGSLLLVKEENQKQVKSFLANVNEYVPVHSYNPTEGENQTLLAEQLSNEKIDAKMVVLALNTAGTRIAAIYIMEGNKP